MGEVMGRLEAVGWLEAVGLLEGLAARSRSVRDPGRDGDSGSHLGVVGVQEGILGGSNLRGLGQDRGGSGQTSGDGGCYGTYPLGGWDGGLVEGLLGHEALDWAGSPWLIGGMSNLESLEEASFLSRHIRCILDEWESRACSQDCQNNLWGYPVISVRWKGRVGSVL